MARGTSGLTRLPVLVVKGPRGVTVSTLDSESSDRGSNPREAFFQRHCIVLPDQCLLSLRINEKAPTGD